MKIQIIHVSAPEKGYNRGKDNGGKGIRHERERPFLLVDGQNVPPEVLDELHSNYPGTDREPVKAEMVKEFNRQPTPLYAIVQEIEIAQEKDEGPAQPPAAPTDETVANGDVFAKYSYPEVQELASKAGISPVVGVSRKKLVAALTEAGVVPSASEG